MTERLSEMEMEAGNQVRPQGRLDIPTNVRAGYTELYFRVEGKAIGKISVTYMAQPFSLFHVSWFEIWEGFQDQKHGREMLQQLNDFLKEQGVAGMLENTIDSDEQPFKKEMYERHGWQPVAGYPSILVYNLQPGTTQEALVEAAKIFTVESEQEH